jgi:glutathione S-transferase
MPTLYGFSTSPFVRKVRVYHAEKGLPYDLETVFPINVSDEYRKISPLGKVPAYRDGDVALADSSVICAYLERLNPEPPLYPSDPHAYARALWFEEYGDSGLSGIIGSKIFFPMIVGPAAFNRPKDEAAAKKAVDEELPPFLDYLEGELGEAPVLVGGAFSIADISVGSQFVNLGHCGFGVDAKRWPKLAAYLDTLLSRPSFKVLIEEERKTLGVEA